MVVHEYDVLLCRREILELPRVRHVVLRDHPGRVEHCPDDDHSNRNAQGVELRQGQGCEEDRTANQLHPLVIVQPAEDGRRAGIGHQDERQRHRRNLPSIRSIQEIVGQVDQEDPGLQLEPVDLPGLCRSCHRKVELHEALSLPLVEEDRGKRRNEHHEHMQAQDKVFEEYHA